MKYLNPYMYVYFKSVLEQALTIVLLSDLLVVSVYFSVKCQSLPEKESDRGGEKLTEDERE